VGAIPSLAHAYTMLGWVASLRADTETAEVAAARALASLARHNEPDVELAVRSLELYLFARPRRRLRRPPALHAALERLADADVSPACSRTRLPSSSRSAWTSASALGSQDGGDRHPSRTGPGRARAAASHAAPRRRPARGGPTGARCRSSTGRPPATWSRPRCGRGCSRRRSSSVPATSRWRRSGCAPRCRSPSRCSCSSPSPSPSGSPSC
jgi:hypothetical protein